MTRRCSHCSNNGHNSRTCPARAAVGVRLFGVRLTEGVGSMKKSASMGNLTVAHSSAATTPAAGYASDDPACSPNCRSERKKGIPWTEEEHRMFLAGLQELGKGDWRGIARNFVVSRNPTQVASHAQKYFIRQTNASRRKRRSSMFDIIPEMQVDHLPSMEEEQLMLVSPPSELEIINQLRAEPIGSNSVVSKEESTYSEIPVTMVPDFYPALIRVPFGFWPQSTIASAPVKDEEDTCKTHEVLKPTPVLPKDNLVNADAVSGMSKLSIAEGPATRLEPSALSVKLMGSSSSRQSAFHGLSQRGNNPIHAV